MITWSPLLLSRKIKTVATLSKSQDLEIQTNRVCHMVVCQQPAGKAFAVPNMALEQFVSNVSGTVLIYQIEIVCLQRATSMGVNTSLGSTSISHHVKPAKAVRFFAYLRPKNQEVGGSFPVMLLDVVVDVVASIVMTAEGTKQIVQRKGIFPGLNPIIFRTYRAFFHLSYNLSTTCILIRFSPSCMTVL
jgi:hypothetical protein